MQVGRLQAALASGGGTSARTSASADGVQDRFMLRADALNEMPASIRSRAKRGDANLVVR